MNIRIETDLANMTRVWIDGVEAREVWAVRFEHKSNSPPRFKLLRLRPDDEGIPRDRNAPRLMDVLEQSDETGFSNT